MWTLISVSLALGINFYIPEIPETNKSMVINKKYYQRMGFPYQYFEGEVLTDEQVRDCGIQTVMGEQCYVVKHDRTRIFLAFKVDSR